MIVFKHFISFSLALNTRLVSQQEATHYVEKNLFTYKSAKNMIFLRNRYVNYLVHQFPQINGLL